MNFGFKGYKLFIKHSSSRKFDWLLQGQTFALSNWQSKECRNL